MCSTLVFNCGLNKEHTCNRNMENAYFLFAFIISLSFISPIQTISCYNRCNWMSWNEWSDCDRQCAGGTRRRDRLFCCRLDLVHDMQSCMTNCGLIYEDQRSGFYDSEECNTFCYNGGTIVSNRYCRCSERYRGTCCKDVVTCGQPRPISFGSFSGNDFTYEGQVVYTCNLNYNMTDLSQATRNCTKYGTWSGSSPACLYATSCASSPCKNGAKCVNLLGDYKCDCKTGWSGKNCEVDTQPPLVSDCPSDINVTVTNMTSYLSWTEPNITDPHGTDVLITQNYQISSYDFPWGEHTIQYNGVKLSNGMSAECKFNLNVKPFPCKDLDIPGKGIVLCNGWRTDYSKICFFVCKQNYTLPPGFNASDIYVCGATGHWLPQISVAQCVTEKLFPDYEVGQFPTCTSPKDKQGLAEFYIDLLKASEFNDLCMRHFDDCSPKNVIITC